MGSKLLYPLVRSLNRGLTRNSHLPSPFLGPRPWNALSTMEDTFRDMDRQFNQMFRDMNSVFREIGYPRWSQGALALEEPEVISEGDKSKYRLNVHVGTHIPPENVKVSLKDRVMTIEAKADQKSEDGTSRVYQEFTRKFTLPEQVDVKEVKTIMEPDGVLHIEAPLSPGALPELPKPKEIPIQIEQ